MGVAFSLEALKPTTVHEFNMTHNLGPMARAAGVYEALWNSNGLPAGNLIQDLTVGLANLQSRPAYYRTFNPENGWGRYEDLVNAVEQTLAACMVNPEAIIHIWK